MIFCCCFCGKDVKDAKPVILHWGQEDKDWQQWWCHLDCFVASLAPEAREFAWEHRK